MGERIYIMSGEGLEPMEEEPFDLEDTLQALIAEHPELLDGAQITPEDPRRWILVTREKGIAATPGGADWWALDNLYIDQDAVPTLVEVKRGANPEIRRKVVGQMLDYAAHAPRSWTADELRRTFEESNHDSDSALWSLLGEEEGDEEENGELWQSKKDAFWKDVATNLAAKNIRLLFVADEIPDTLARVVEFLNEQMPNIEVLAVEIKQFKGKSSQTLVPHVLGRTAAAPGKNAAGARRRSKVTFESFMAQLPNDAVRKATERLLNIAREHGAKPYYGDKGFSIRIQLRQGVWRLPLTVAWFFPPSDSSFWAGLWGFSFGTGILMYSDPSPDERLRAVLENWTNQFAGDNFGENHFEGSDQHLWARSTSHDDAAQNIDLLAERLERVLSDLRAL